MSDRQPERYKRIVSMASSEFLDDEVPPTPPKKNVGKPVKDQKQWSEVNNKY